MFIFVIIGWLLTCCGPLMWSHVCLLEFNELMVWCEFTYHFTSLLLLHIFELRTWTNRKKTQMDFHSIFLSCTLVSVARPWRFFLFAILFLPSLQLWRLARNDKYDGSRRVPGRKYAHFFFLFLFYFLFLFFCFLKYVLCGFCLTLYSGNA